MQKTVVIYFLLWCCSTASKAQLYQSLRFEPATVDFGSWAVGTAMSQSVTLINQNSNRSVYLSSVSGKTADFYSSFFESKVVPPMGNTTFSVVFLPRGSGAVAADLLIHTSFGQTHLLVRGEGRECPYRLKPIVGIKAPLNSTLSPEIHMYNPHGKPLQILEVYSSGGQFQLELPSGGNEGPQVLWEIPPHSTKPVIRIRFHGQSAGNYTAYIRIKISERQDSDTEPVKENMLVVPVEFQILPEYGLYAENPLLDFGRITTEETAKIKLKLQLQNSHNKRQFELDAVSAQEWSEVPEISYNAIYATVTLNPQLFEHSHRLNELLILRSNEIRDSNERAISLNAPAEFSIIVRANIFKGTLAYNRNTSIFVTQSTNYIHGEKREFIVRNDFDIPITLLNINLQNDDSNMISMETFEATDVIIAPGTSLKVLELSVLNDSSDFETSLTIYTNITNFVVPVVVCTGRLHISAYDSKTLVSNATHNLELDLGAIPLGKMSHFGYVVMQNHNPIAVEITTWTLNSSQNTYFYSTFLGCLRSSALRAFRNESNVSIDSAKFKLCTHLQAGDVAVFEVAIQSSFKELDRQAAALKIWTPYEEITVNVTFHTWLGKLEVAQEQLYFNNCFPGKICTAQLAIHSTFKHNIHVKSMHFNADGLWFEDYNHGGSVIMPETVTTIGRIYLEPAQLCQQRCYIPQEDFTQLQAIFPPPDKTKGGPNNNLHFDEMELRRRTELYRQLKMYNQTIGFTLKSHEVRQFPLQLTIDLEWPKLVAGVQTLPTIEVGNSQQLTVTIANPSNSAILIDYFLADPKYAKDTQLSLPLEVIDASSNCYLTDKSTFSLPSGSPGKPILVPAQQNISVPVHFQALDADSYCTLLHIRNNLTLYEAVWLTAKTVQSQFRFGNRKPGSNTPLLFEVNEKLMAVCAHQKQQDKSMEPILTVKRSFTARNTGEIAIRVDGFLIGDQPCEGYGFKVIDCNGFDLKANASKKIEIVFNPDFTATRISRPLVLLSNLSYEIKYVLLAQLPSTNLDKCAELQPRPVWEPRIRNAAILLLATTFIFVLITAHVDYGNILVNQSALYAAREKGPIHHFNLRNIVAAKDNIRTMFDNQIEQKINPTIAVNKTATPTVNLNTNTNANYISDNCQQTTTKPAPQNSQSNNNNYNNSQNNNNLRKRSGVKQKQIQQQPNFADDSWALQLSTAFKDTNNIVMSESGGVKITQLPNERSSKSKSECSGSNSSGTPTSETSPILNNTSISNKTVAIKLNQNHQVKETLQTTPNNSNSITNTNSSGKKKQRDLKKSKNATNVALNSEKTTTSTPCDKNVVRLSKLNDKNSIVNEPYAPAANSTNDIGIMTTNDVAKPRSPTSAVASPQNKDANGTRQKIGKTPGRERKKEIVSQTNCANSSDTRLNSMLSSSSSSSSCSSSSTNSKRNERKQKGKSVNALNFQGVGATNDVRQNMSPFTIPSTSQWDAMNQISFSKILQQNDNATANNLSDTTILEISAGQVEQMLQRMDATATRQHQQQQQQQPQQQQQQQQQSNEAILNAELGPIGSKKSPCATPSVWEPIASESPTANVIETAQQLQQTLISNNSSFFSNVLPNNFNSNDFAEQQQQQQPQQQQYINVPPANNAVNFYNMEYYLNLRQQQLQAQQQLMQCTDNNNALNWNSTSAWSPMNYEQNASTANTLGGFAALQGGWQHSLNNAGGMCGGGNNMNSGVMRPPPGLEGNAPGVGHNIRQPNSANMSGIRQTEANMQPFDPFRSLSSIWNDDWHKQQQNAPGNNN